jgi:hypothetical protein
LSSALAHGANDDFGSGNLGVVLVLGGAFNALAFGAETMAPSYPLVLLAAAGLVVLVAGLLALALAGHWHHAAYVQQQHHARAHVF